MCIYIFRSKRIQYMLFSAHIRLSPKEITTQQSDSFTRSRDKFPNLLRRSKWNLGLKVLVPTPCLRGVENTLTSITSTFGRGTHPEPGNTGHDLEVQAPQGSDNVPLKHNNLLQKWPAIMWLAST